MTTDYEAKFSDAMRNAGITPPETFNADGILHRFSTHGKPGNNDGSYWLKTNEAEAWGYFKDWHSGIEQDWNSRNGEGDGKPRTKAENLEHKKIIQASQLAKEAENNKRHEEARERSTKFWKTAISAKDDHSYLIRKVVKSHGLKLHKGALAVPVMDGDVIHSLQFIYPDGKKIFEKGGRISGCYFIIGESKNTPTIAIAEGYATGATIHEATGIPVAIAFNCGNLEPVAIAIRKRFPDTKIVICADDDWKTEGNPGSTKGRKAAEAIDAYIASPDFGDGRGEKDTDFNDLAALRGPETVLKCINEAKLTGNEPLPLPPELPPVEPFDMMLVPASLRSWLADIAERMQCPPDFPGVAAMVAIGSLIGSKIAIRPKQKDNWSELANLWGFLCGNSGLMKTPAISEALIFIYLLVGNARKQHEKDLIDHGRKTVLQKMKSESIQKKARKAVEDGDDEGAIRLLDNAGDEVKAPTERRFVVNDSTVEKLGELLNENPNGLLVYRDELTGWLRTLEKDNHENDRSFYLEAHNGKVPYTYDRIGRGTLPIANTCISILGGIQPGPLTDYVRQAFSGGAGADGMIQRFQMAVWPDVNPYCKIIDRSPDTIAKNNACSVFEHLADLDPETIGASRDDGRPYLRFTAPAQEIFNGWLEQLERRLRSGIDHEAFVGHLSKYRKLVPALSLIDHLANHGRGNIGPESVSVAIAWAKYLESHAKRIYFAATNPAIGAAKKLMIHILDGDLPNPFTARDVYKTKGWAGLTTKEQVEESIDTLEHYGWVSVIERPKTKVGGRSTFDVFKNPLAKKENLLSR